MQYTLVKYSDTYRNWIRHKDAFLNQVILPSLASIPVFELPEVLRRLPRRLLVLRCSTRVPSAPPNSAQLSIQKCRSSKDWPNYTTEDVTMLLNHNHIGRKQSRTRRVNTGLLTFWRVRGREPGAEIVMASL